jgi:hypothetical protein
MPFRSQAQRRFMYARHPEIAKRWRKEHGPQRELPERTGARKRDKRQRLIDNFVARHRK